jgi:hypothetical protein
MLFEFILLGARRHDLTDIFMRGNLRLIQCIAIVLLFVGSTPASAAEKKVHIATDSLVRLLVDSDAVEYRKARRIHYDKNNADMAAVFFTIENFNRGNNYTFYLAVFEASWKSDPEKEDTQQRNSANISKYRLVGYSPIGGKGWRSIDFNKVTIEKRQITLQTKEYVGDDPMCCPSKIGTVVYRIEDKQLVELKPNR